MCVAAYFTASVPFPLHYSPLFKLELAREGFQMKSLTFYLQGTVKNWRISNQ